MASNITSYDTLAGNTAYVGYVNNNWFAILKGTNIVLQTDRYSVLDASVKSENHQFYDLNWNRLKELSYKHWVTKHNVFDIENALSEMKKVYFDNKAVLWD